jgi:hypothetical protein
MMVADPREESKELFVEEEGFPPFSKISMMTKTFSDKVLSEHQKMVERNERVSEILLKKGRNTLK